MASGTQLIQSSFSRVFLLEQGAGPRVAPAYEGLMRAAGLTLAQGKLTSVFIPDPAQYGKFQLVTKIAGEPGLPQLTLEARYTVDMSKLLRMVNGQCDHDIHIHIGTCRNPTDFNSGWDKVVVLEGARESDYSTSDLGALDPAQDAAVTETGKFEGTSLYELKGLGFAEKAATQINDEVVQIAFCDSPSCGQCGAPSDGCQTIFAVTASSAGSPGLLASIIWTTDGGTTWFNDPIDSLAANSTPTGLACIGANMVVISNVGGSLEIAALADILAGTETWQEVTTGFVAAKGPNAIFSLTQTKTLIVGDGGYIYSTQDPASGVTVLDPGVASTQNLKDISAVDQDNILVVGNSNAVVVSSDGGLNWISVTGPSVGNNLLACWMQSKSEWWVGTSNGKLYYTVNSGLNWYEKTFPGSGTGVVRDIKFVNGNVGYLAHSTATPRGRILRTIDGGYDWYVLPDNRQGTMPTNQRINSLAVCNDANKVLGGGLGSNGTDGIIVLGS